MPTSFDVVVVKQDGFKVEFSNRGTKPKFIKYRCRNPERKHVKCAVEGCREVTNVLSGVCKAHRKEHKYMAHVVDWIARIIPPGGTRKAYLTNAPSFGDLTESLCSWAFGTAQRTERLTHFFESCMEKVPGEIPDATSLQAAFEGEIKDVLTPRDIVMLARDVVESHFPAGQFISKRTINRGRLKNVKRGVPIRLIASLLFLAYVCEESNRGDLWYKKKLGMQSNAGNAGCYMAAGYFLYRRYTHASQRQIRMCLKG